MTVADFFNPPPTDTLIFWVIYRGPADMPEAPYVVRPQYTQNQTGFIIASARAVTAQTLDEARALIPGGLYRQERDPSDPQAIVESGLIAMHDDLGAADERARAEWEDGAGADCVTTAGVWHAAIAYERGRVAAQGGAGGQTEEAVAERALQEFSAKVAPLHLPTFFWIGLPKTNASLYGGSGDMAEVVRGRLISELYKHLKRLPLGP